MPKFISVIVLTICASLAPAVAAPYTEPADSFSQAAVSAESGRSVFVKTNVPAWGMLWVNASAEWNFADNFSAQLPIYYSGFNYFSGNRKFRTFAVMPEVRWWCCCKNNYGIFVGLNAGFGFYNVAFGGALRYQDHKGRTPAIGGGLNVGYRFRLGTQSRWMIECSLGAGAYALHYDTFENRPNGPLTGTHRRSYWGLDHAAISVGYRFDLKGGGR